METVSPPVVNAAISFELTAPQRRHAVVALVVTLVVLLGAGLVLDRVTTQTTILPGTFVAPAVPFPRDVKDSLVPDATPRPFLGRAATGQPWQAVKGVWTVDASGAFVSQAIPGQPSLALIDAGRGDGSVAVTAAHVQRGMGLAFRCESELNCWTLTATPEFGTWQLTKITGAQVIDMQNIGTAPVADGTRVRVDDRADGFDIFVNDVKMRHVDSRELADKPFAGLAVGVDGDPTAARFRDFSAQQLNIVGPDAPVRDAFDRAAGNRLGRTPTGQGWTVSDGTWGIRKQEAVLQSAPSLKASVATVDAGRSQGWVQATASTMPAGTGLVFRYRDPANYWWVDAVPAYGVFNVFRIVSGVVTKAGVTPAVSFGDGSTITVRLRGDAVTIFVDGFEATTITSPVLTNARGAGLIVDSPKALGARFAGFAAGPLSIAGTGS